MRQQSIHIALSFHFSSATGQSLISILSQVGNQKERQPQGLVTPDDTDYGDNENADNDDGNKDDI